MPIMSPYMHLNGDNGPDIPGTPDRVRFSGDTTSYANSAHWTSILDGVSQRLTSNLNELY